MLLASNVVLSFPMLAFNWELHAWIIPLTFATGWVIGQQVFKDGLRRRHPDLVEELERRTKPQEEKPSS